MWAAHPFRGEQSHAGKKHERRPRTFACAYSWVGVGGINRLLPNSPLWHAPPLLVCTSMSMNASMDADALEHTLLFACKLVCAHRYARARPHTRASMLARTYTHTLHAMHAYYIHALNTLHTYHVQALAHTNTQAHTHTTYTQFTHTHTHAHTHTQHTHLCMHGCAQDRVLHLSPQLLGLLREWSSRQSATEPERSLAKQLFEDFSRCACVRIRELN